MKMELKKGHYYKLIWNRGSFIVRAISQVKNERGIMLDCHTISMKGFHSLPKKEWLGVKRQIFIESGRVESIEIPYHQVILECLG